MSEKQPATSLSNDIQDLRDKARDLRADIRDLRDDLYRFDGRTNRSMVFLMANLIFIYGMVLENDFIEWIGIGVFLMWLISFIVSWIVDWRSNKSKRVGK